MIDFLKISTRSPKKGVIEIYPSFIIKKSSDLMIRGGDFYAIWVEERGLWSTDEQDAMMLIDREVDKFAEEHRKHFDSEQVRVLHMWDSASGVIDWWHRYCQKQMRDNFHNLDEKIIFSNMETKRSDYASKKLPYPLEKGDISAYDQLMSVLYSETERRKIEWAIGSIVNGDSKKIQKFLVFYGSAGTGKSTVLNIIQQLFEGYYSVFDAKALGSANSAFALEPFKSNPLVAIQHDGDLSRIEDNTRLNSLVSHEYMTVNEKFKSAYTSQFKCFLFMGTNKPVKITDAKSGLLRRLIDVTPTGEKVDIRTYRSLMSKIEFELGAIAEHCRSIYEEDPYLYDDYIPTEMMGASNDFYNYVEDSYYVFQKEDGTTLKAAWEMYKEYCDDANVPYPYSQRVFKEELKNYFREFEERHYLKDGTRIRNYYKGFIADKFHVKVYKKETPKETSWIIFEEQRSFLDQMIENNPAQYANDNGTPLKKWDDVQTYLHDLDTHELHYVKIATNHIVIDFDIPDENGNKSYEKNLEAASKWPPTYAELSKSGAGIHLHYIYSGDPEKLSRVYDDHIEVKVFTGNSSLRRKLTKCNNLPIATISSGLPLKGDKKVVNYQSIKSENDLRRRIKRNLNREIHPNTKPSIDLICKQIEDAYESGLKYDISDMEEALVIFAASSTHQSDYCLKKVAGLKLRSEEPEEFVSNDEAPIVFFDVEVFPNLFLVNWKLQGEENPVVRMINPSPTEVGKLFEYRLVGYNNRRYDNHMLYARFMGYTNEQLYSLSDNIINEKDNKRKQFFREAYNLSYTDVYDFSSKKQSLKKFEIELGIHHKELGLPWDQPVPEELWSQVAEYCDNDVIATEAVFNARQSDFTARKILADITGMSVNDSTNSLSTEFIFGKEKRRLQDQKYKEKVFNYRDLGKLDGDLDNFVFKNESFYGSLGDPEYFVFNRKGQPVFPGYIFGQKTPGSKWVSTYRGEEVGEGGYVYAEPGIHTNVALLDIASMHPSSIVAEELFGSNFTDRFKEILDARLAIKHEDWKRAEKMLDGALKPYIQQVKKGDLTSKDLASALKIVINSVYGLTSAKFNNAFRDNRNIDNIVAKRGALFMVNLKYEVQKRGFTVAHIKTDSIKIPNATPEIIKFVMDYGEAYGYTFEHEATYEKMCLVNDAVYIAKYADGDWTATGTQFQVPYVFKTLFSKEPIEFADLCETKAVTSALYLDLNEKLEDVSDLEKQKKKLVSGLNKLKKADDIISVEEEIKANVEAIADLDKEIAKGHEYCFVGRVGSFIPVKKGNGGGLLMRDQKGKMVAAEGTKGYRWIEAETIQDTFEESKDIIDMTYYQKLVDRAVEDISQYGDFEWFAA